MFAAALFLLTDNETSTYVNICAHLALLLWEEWRAEKPDCQQGGSRYFGSAHSGDAYA